MTCPSALAQGTVTGLITKFMRLHPKVRVELDSSDRTLDIIEERIDIALRARDSGLTLPGLVARRIASGSFVLVASPDYVARRSAPETPSDLTRHDTIGSLREGEEQGWTLTARDGRIERVTVRPRFLCSDYTVQYQSALGGVCVPSLASRVARP
jgi:DNA-binding transcriptional LysR family regulator